MKKILSLLLSASLLAVLLVGCGNSKDGNTAEGTNETTKKLVVGATPAPHAEILEFVKPILEEEGIELEVKIFTDYVIPNNALASKDIDANFFQHKPFLDEFNDKNNQELVSKATVHFEPLGVYPGRTAKLEDLEDGAEIAIPNDASNRTRALKLLEAQGLIQLKQGTGESVTVKDIAENSKNLKFTEVAAVQVAKVLPDVAVGVVNGNYAIEEGISDKALAKEASTSEGAKTYANILAVRPDNQNDEAIVKLAQVLNSGKVKQFIEEKYQGDFVPTFE